MPYSQTLSEAMLLSHSVLIKATMSKMKFFDVIHPHFMTFLCLILFVLFPVHIRAQIQQDTFMASIIELSNIYQSGLSSQKEDRCSELERIIKKWFDTNPKDAVYSQHLFRYAVVLCLKGEYKNAVSAGEEAVDIYKKLYGEDEVFLIFIDCLATIYNEAADYSKSKQTYSQALDLRRRLFNQESEAYVEGLKNVISADYYIAKYTEAIDSCKQAFIIYEKIGASNDELYVDLVMYYSLCLRAIGDYKEAIKFQLLASDYIRRLYGEQSGKYAAALNNISMMYSDFSDYKNAIAYVSKAIDIQKHIEGDYSSIASMYINLGSYYFDMGHYEQSASTYKQTLNILKDTYGESHPLYASALNGLALVYLCMSQYDEAIRNSLKALDIRKNVFGTSHPKYMESLSSVSQCYMSYGNYKEALRYAEEAKLVCKTIYGENHDTYAKILMNLSGLYNDTEESDKALENAKIALSIFEKTKGKNHRDYAVCLSVIASVYKNQKEYDKAFDLEKEAFDICCEIYGNKHSDVASLLNNLSVSCYYKKEYDKALEYAKQSLQIKENLFGKESRMYASSLNSVALIYHKLGDYTKAIESFKEYTDIVENHLLKMFLGSNVRLRETYWNSNAVAFNSVYPSDFFCYWEKLNEEQRNLYAGDVYNKSALFAKGLLLNTEQEISKLIDEANDPEIKQIYTTLRDNRDYLSKLYEIEVSRRPEDTDSIEQVTQRLELELHQKLKSFGDYTKNLCTTWRDVQSNLKEGDLAIEFLTSTMEEDNDVMYFALVLKPGYTAPHMVPLFEGKKIKEIDKNDIYTTSAMSGLLWEPMKKELKGVTNVYFSPIGALHNIGIEYLPLKKGVIISKKYNLCRLSSTRQLTIEHQNLNDWNAVLYGGIQYDADTQTLVEENRQYNISEENVDNVVALEDISRALENTYVRGGCGYLPGTKVEVDNISSAFDSDAIMYKKHTGITGTEESLKSLSGTKPNVLHIATHGFYWTETEAEKIKKTHDQMQFLNMDNNDSATEEDKAMTRSGLMMAGSNRIIKGETLPSGVDDGILTAKEISKLDLRGLGLVVLSACQTALGDISGSEGVFGLQRAFKKAGAQTLLMSLWKVDDKATEILMSEFYQNLVAGMTKKQAFMEAQASLRSIDHDPNHWAAFIMLDAIK